jgi:hypothetical protein
MIGGNIVVTIRLELPAPFRFREAEAGGDLPEEWQALIASQASMLAAMVARRYLVILPIPA